jgi:chromosome segregation ATPase
MKKTPYPKKPPSQYKTPPFYFRGGDILREREYLADEYKKALVDYRRAEYDLRQVEEELMNDHETLHEREGYTTALANYLDADTEGNQTEQEYKRRLMRVEADIKKLEAELQQARGVHHPAVAANLQKERAYLAIEIQRTQKAVELTDEQRDGEKRKLAEVEISPRYQTVVDLETKVLDLNRKYQFLRSLVSKYKKEFDATRTVPPSQTDEARLERAAFASLVDAKYSLTRADEKAKRKPGKWREQIDRLLLEIEDLNERMTDLAMPEDQLVDVDALRARFRLGDEEEQDKGGQKKDDATGEDWGAAEGDQLGDSTGAVAERVD